MALQKLSAAKMVIQILPGKKQAPLEGLYLGQKLNEISVKTGKTLVITNFLSDRNGVIAKADNQNHFHVPAELKNHSDWRLFQELMAQTDVAISSSSYLERVSAPGSRAEDILFQFEPGAEFEGLGEWRLSAGYKRRSPDLALVTRHLDFKFPERLLKSGRKILIFTTYAMADSDKARDLSNSGIVVIGSGGTGVDGERMIAALSNGTGYRVIMMSGGPGVLQLLLEANRLDLLYITEVQREIPFDDLSGVKTVLAAGKKVNELQGFSLSHQYLQENVVTEDGASVSQLLSRYDRKDILSGGENVLSGE